MQFSQGEEKKDEGEDESVPTYTLKEYCQNLHVESETVSGATYWFIDWTTQCVKNDQGGLLKHVILDYCQPVFRYTDLQNRWMGMSSLSKWQEAEPLAIRTVSIRIRPDAKQEMVMESIRKAVLGRHKKYNHVLKSTPEAWVAILGEGDVPICMSAMLATHHSSHQRRLFLRFYVFTSIQMECSVADRFEDIFSGSRYEAPSTLDDTHRQLIDACLVVQHMWKNRLQCSDAAPGLTYEESARWFKMNYQKSKSVEDIVGDFTSKRDAHSLFPSLAEDDLSVLNESIPLVESVWYELQKQKCTYDTIAVQSSQFGQRPCRTTLDKGYCWQLAQTSHLQMLRELQPKVEITDSSIHDTLQSLQELQIFLVNNVLIQTYRAPVNSEAVIDLEVESAPIRLPSRKLEDFPWNPAIRRSLKHITEWTGAAISRDFDPVENLNMAEQAVRHVTAQMAATDDNDQKNFLRERNQATMSKVKKGHEVCKALLKQIQQAPQVWKNKVPRLRTAIDKWQAIGAQCKVNPLRPAAIPLLEFPTKLGQCCVTCDQFVLQVKMAMLSQVYVFDYKTTDVRATPNHPLTKLTVLENGKKVAGCNPVGVDVSQVVKLMQTLKTLQD